MPNGQCALPFYSYLSNLFEELRFVLRSIATDRQVTVNACACVQVHAYVSMHVPFLAIRRQEGVPAISKQGQSYFTSLAAFKFCSTMQLVRTLCTFASAIQEAIDLSAK